MSISYEAEQIIGELEAQIRALKRLCDDATQDHDRYREALVRLAGGTLADVDEVRAVARDALYPSLREPFRAPCPIHDFPGGFCVGYCAAQVAAQAEAMFMPEDEADRQEWAKKEERRGAR